MTVDVWFDYTVKQTVPYNPELTSYDNRSLQIYVNNVSPENLNHGYLAQKAREYLLREVVSEISGQSITALRVTNFEPWR